MKIKVSAAARITGLGQDFNPLRKFKLDRIHRVDFVYMVEWNGKEIYESSAAAAGGCGFVEIQVGGVGICSDLKIRDRASPCILALVFRCLY